MVYARRCDKDHKALCPLSSGSVVHRCCFASGRVHVELRLVWSTSGCCDSVSRYNQYTAAKATHGPPVHALLQPAGRCMTNKIREGKCLKRANETSLQHEPAGDDINGAHFNGSGANSADNVHLATCKLNAASLGRLSDYSFIRHHSAVPRIPSRRHLWTVHRPTSIASFSSAVTWSGRASFCIFQASDVIALRMV